MTSTGTLDFSRLLMPIPGNEPFGEDLRFDFSLDSPYHKIKDPAPRPAPSNVAWIMVTTRMIPQSLTGERF